MMLTDVQCPGITCVPRGDQHRNDTTLELAGMLGAFRGKPMFLRIDDAVAHREVMRQAGETGENGRYAASIPVDNLRPGRYEFLLMPGDANGMVIMVGRFTVALANAPPTRAPSPMPVASRAPPPRPAAAPAPAQVPENVAALRALVGT
ncbi:MAG: hypothetical protein ACHQF3_03610, partial [Alphaproteobacteria bacterium]